VSADAVVRNAGLVLFWPFLPRYFSVLKLVEGGAFVDARSRMKAMQLMGFLESGEDQLPEYRMTLIKLLCGHPAAGPLEHPVTLVNEGQKGGCVASEIGHCPLEGAEKYLCGWVSGVLSIGATDCCGSQGGPGSCSWNASLMTCCWISFRGHTRS
jgi:hypothetical protein